MKPKRIQRKRTKGWKMPEGAVYVGRPTKYGNPVKLTPGMSRWKCADEFRRIFTRDTTPEQLETLQAELRGKDLACWCPLDQPCHADVLLEIANA